MKRPLALLIQPPVYDFALYDHYIKPVGLLRLARWLKTAGWETEIVNALDYAAGSLPVGAKKLRRRKDGTGKFFRREAAYPDIEKRIPRPFSRYGVPADLLEQGLRGLRPDLILITSGMTYWYPGVREAARLCRRLFPAVPLLVGGTYATLMTQHCREVIPCDEVIAGGGERALRRFLQHRSLPAPPGPIPFQPEPAWEGWRDAAVLRLREGCPFRCRYCASSALHPAFHADSLESLLGQFRSIRERWGTRNFAFYDDALLFRSHELFKPFLEGVIAQGGASFFTPNAVHLKYIEYETACLMRRAGFREVRVGFESLSADFHRQYDGKVESGALAEKGRTLAAAGFRAEDVRVYILAGLPGQRVADIRDSIRYVRSLGHPVSLTEFSPVPGSPGWEEWAPQCQYPLAEEPLYHNNTLFPFERPDFTAEDLRRLKGEARQAPGG